jgi:putative hydroxymethylpyrimidine transport system ATP-binding protein
MNVSKDICIPDIKISQAYMYYKDKKIFENLSIFLPGGQWTCLLGTSGVGKSTLLRMIAGVLSNDSAMQSNAYCAGKIKTSDNIPLKGRVAYMAQDDLLMPWSSALENVLIGCKLRGERNSDNINKAKELLALVELEDSMHLKPNNMSGGMRQRVALARTLLENKPTVLMDEPFSALDAITRYKLRNLAAKLLKNRTVLLVTHDPLEALCLGNNIKIMIGNPARILDIEDIPRAPIPRDSSTTEVIALYGKILKQMTGYN